MSLNREQIIEQIENNIDYYSQFTDLENIHEDSRHHAIAQVEALKEILKQIEEYDDVFDFRKPLFEDFEA